MTRGVIEVRRCTVCKCTEDRGCPGGCSWVGPALCSACVTGRPRRTAELMGRRRARQRGPATRDFVVSHVVHNLIAHPLLVLCPPVGEWLHERTEP